MRIAGLWLEAMLQRVYPPTCVLCGAAGDDGLDLCRGCRADLPHNRHACPRCASPLPPGQSAGVLCGPCQRRAPPFAASHAAFRYEDPLPTLVGGMKFRARFNLARLLGQLMASALLEQGARRPEVILPVPLHPRRLRERGYNQALELARPISAALGVPTDTVTCIRAVYTSAQVGLSGPERRRNMRGAFEVVRSPVASHLAILDDVVTTGSTVTELAQVLRRAGVERVDVWAVARTS